MNEHVKTEYTDLDNLSTEALKEIIRADFTSDDSDDDYVMRALEVIEQRELSNGTANPIDVNAAWKDFRQIYCTEEGRGQSLYDSREPQDTVEPRKPNTARKTRKAFRRTIKRVGLVAALLALFLAGMVTVQAAGVDIFGAIARWTDEVFHFESTGASATPEWHDELISQGVDPSLLPTWIPEGFEAGELVMDEFDAWTQIRQSFYHQCGRELQLQILLYSDSSFIEHHLLEKDSADVERYAHKGKTYYLFSNLGQSSGVCLDNMTETYISGNFSLRDLKRIIKSIGGT